MKTYNYYFFNFSLKKSIVLIRDKVAAFSWYLGLYIEKAPCRAFFIRLYLVLVDYHYRLKSETFAQSKPSSTSESEGQSRRHLPSLIPITLRRAGSINYVVFDCKSEFVIM